MLLLCFAVVLLLAVLVSSLANRTILSTAVLFLAAGIAVGPETTELVVFFPLPRHRTALADLVASTAS